MDGFGTLRARGKAGAGGPAPEGAARGEPRPAPASGGARRREQPPGGEARRGAHAHRGAPQADPGDRIVTTEAKTREKGAVTISLLGREFRVGCPEGEERQLMASVDYLNRKLKEVRDTGKVVGNERIAI